MEQSRRNLLGFATGSALLPFAISQSAEAHQPRTVYPLGYGMSVSIRWAGRWEVAVPAQQQWRPGNPIAIEWVPFDEFTAQLEREMLEAQAVG